MKQVYKNDGITAYDGFKDVFGNKMFVVVNEDLGELRLYGKNKDYKKEFVFLERSGLSRLFKVHKYLIVIDITEKTKKKIENLFPGYVHSEWQVW